MRGFELFDGNLMEYAGREDELRGLMARLGLELVGVYSGANFIFPDILEEELSKIAGVVQLAASLGAAHLVVGGGAIRSSGIEERDFRLLGEGLERVVGLAEQAGLIPTFHPHLGTCAQSPEQIAKVFAHTTIGFCPDTAHLEAGGGDPVELMRTYSGRMPYVHLKDYADGAFRPLGEGGQDLTRILDDLVATGYDGWITVELDSFPGHPVDAARTSKAYLDERLTRRNG
jgi:inosose dehydratase